MNGSREMGEPDAAGRDDLVTAIRRVLEQFGITDGLAAAEAVAVCWEHPKWAVWLPAAGDGWVAVRPAGSRPPGPELPMLWVRADTAQELGVRMRQADAGLMPDQGR